MRKYLSLLLGLLFFAAFIGCNGNSKKNENENKKDTTVVSETQKELDQFVEFTLKTDLSVLTEKEKQMLPILVDAAKIMNDLFWKVSLGEDTITGKLEDEAAKKLFAINYGPWNRLEGNEPFIEGIGEKPAGANFYPSDMTEEEFKAFEDESKTSLYTIIRRDEEGNLKSIPYNEYFKEELTKASELLKKAAELAEDEGLKKYLELRAEALVSNEYFESDMAWMDMKNNTIDVVIGPIENYEDRLFGYKAAFEAFILIKDKSWSDKLEKYSALLPELQKQLPVDDKYKTETPGRNSDLGAYDAIYYAGDCNAGSKTIAINLPNDEKVQMAKGSRRLQLKNSMQAKFDNILIPISEKLISEDQRKHVTFDAFFGNTMFHEVAHGLGVKNTINGKGTARKALEKYYSTIEEGKADILGLWLVTQLNEMGEYEADLMDNYVTFMAGIFRSIRFGTASSHGKANLIRYNYFKEKEAFVKNEDGTYTINFEKMQEAVNSLAEEILVIQGNGDIEAAKKMVEEKHVYPEELKADLKLLEESNIPVDVVWNQGLDVLGL